MPKRLRPIDHEDRLSVVDHLDELRSRLIVCGVAMLVVFIACFVFSGHLLTLLNAPLHHLPKAARDNIGGATGDLVGARRQFLKSAAALQQLATSGHFSSVDRSAIASAGAHLKAGAQALPSHTSADDPVTIGPGEPFFTTLTVCFWFTVLLTLPVLLYQAFAFVVPALNPQERRVATPLVVAGPVLFLSGVIFTYVIVLPAAIRFLQGYNSSHFQSLIQAQQLYSFEVITMAAIGAAFEMPLVMLGLHAVGIVNGTTLTRHWRYGTVIMAVVAAAMPGADPVTTGFEVAPLIVLYLVSIVLLRIADRRAARREAAADDIGPPVGGLTGS